MQVLYEDSDVLVINKPAGVSVHPRAGDTTEKTIVDEIRDKVEDTSTERPGIVHRLDKDTSGVLIIAKNPQAKALLQAQFKNRSVKKTYLALVEGHPKNPHGLLDLPLGRHPKHPFKRAVKGGGKPAVTEYKVIKQFKHASLLEVYPQTGRTHQIRVQLAHLGHPIVGDRLYGRAEPRLNRHFLHAAQLNIRLPGGQAKAFKSPLPTELKTYLELI